jgi:hypothetical protein
MTHPLIGVRVSMVIGAVWHGLRQGRRHAGKEGAAA